MPAKPSTKTRLIGFIALGVCALGYSGMAAALIAAKLGYVETVHAALLAAGSGLIGEIGLWVGAACLGLGLWHKRKAMLARIFGRDRSGAPQV